MAGRLLADAFEHVQRAGVDRDAVPDHGGHGGVVDQVGGEHDAGRLALGSETAARAALYLAQRHGVDHRSSARISLRIWMFELAFCA